MNVFRSIADAFRQRSDQPNRPRPASPTPMNARVYERVTPDGRLVSVRGAISVYALDSPTATLPDDAILYIPISNPEMRFRFTIVRCASGCYRAYIREQPSYGGRRTDMNSTHRLHDSYGHFVCWSPMPTTAHGILKVAKLWAERTARYIVTGRPLEAP